MPGHGLVFCFSSHGSQSVLCYQIGECILTFFARLPVFRDLLLSFLSSAVRLCGLTALRELLFLSQNSSIGQIVLVSCADRLLSRYCTVLGLCALHLPDIVSIPRLLNGRYFLFYCNLSIKVPCELMGAFFFFSLKLDSWGKTW